MHNKVVYRIARALRRAGIVVLRFNFRGVGSSGGEHAHLEGEIEDARVALEWLRGRYPHLPFALAGFSFGARAITRLGCSIQGAEWLLAAGFPTSYGATEYLEQCTVTKLFVQSTNDQYGPRAAIEALYQRVPEPKKLAWVEAKDHFFAGALDAFEQEVGRSIPAFDRS
jgi:alpha/beta superfamily hydrolase